MKISNNFIIVLFIFNLFGLSTHTFAQTADVSTGLKISTSSIDTANKYLNGDGVEKNPKLAFEIFTTLAQQEDPVAQNQLGLMYLFGDGTEQNLEVAYIWFLRASEQNLAEAQNNLATLLINNTTKNRQQIALAISYFNLAAQQNYLPALYNLGTAYYRGDTVTQDYAKAFEYWQICAVLNEPDCQFGLGTMYGSGKGIQQNMVQALKWIAKAKKNEHPQATEFLNMARSEINEPTIQTAIQSLKALAQNNDPDAILALQYLLD